MRGGPGPGRRLRLHQNNTLNKILVFDLSLATGLYALTNYVGKIWALGVVVSAEALRDASDGAARAGLDCVNATSFVMEVARSTSGHVRNVQVCNGRWAQTPARIGFRPAC